MSWRDRTDLELAGYLAAAVEELTEDDPDRCESWADELAEVERRTAQDRRVLCVDTSMMAPWTGDEACDPRTSSPRQALVGWDAATAVRRLVELGHEADPAVLHQVMVLLVGGARVAEISEATQTPELRVGRMIDAVYKLTDTFWDWAKLLEWLEDCGQRAL